MRADVERNTSLGTDAYGAPAAPVFTAVGTLACHVYSAAKREVTDARKAALVEDLRALFPLGSNLAERDEIAKVTDRRGIAIIATRMRISAIQRRRRHLEALLERVQ